MGVSNMGMTRLHLTVLAYCLHFSFHFSCLKVLGIGCLAFSLVLLTISLCAAVFLSDEPFLPSLLSQPLMQFPTGKSFCAGCVFLSLPNPASYHFRRVHSPLDI